MLVHFPGNVPAKGKPWWQEKNVDTVHASVACECFPHRSRGRIFLWWVSPRWWGFKQMWLFHILTSTPTTKSQHISNSGKSLSNIERKYTLRWFPPPFSVFYHKSRVSVIVEVLKESLLSNSPWMTSVLFFQTNTCRRAWFGLRSVKALVTYGDVYFLQLSKCPVKQARFSRCGHTYSGIPPARVPLLYSLLANVSELSQRPHDP